MAEQPVLMVGGTGALGRQVVAALLARGKRVRMLVRPASSAAEFADRGVELVQGDLLDPASLLAATDGADSVITSAAGYTRRTPGDTAETDTVGNRNLVEAAAKSGVRRFVLTSILTCDQTPDVPHFWHKKLVEDHLVELDVPFVALRPGAFLESLTQFGGDPFARRLLIYAGSASTPMTFVDTPDLARCLAMAVDAATHPQERVDIGLDRAVSIAELAAIASERNGKRIRSLVIPGRALSATATVAGRLSPVLTDMSAMFRWFQSGNYVADTRRQHELFGPPTTAEAAVGQLMQRLGHNARH